MSCHLVLLTMLPVLPAEAKVLVDQYGRRCKAGVKGRCCVEAGSSHYAAAAEAVVAAVASQPAGCHRV
jgi:hypothetical protein